MMIFEPPVKGQRFFAPEVVQTSAMDCGPAALKCLLEGFGIPVSYGRLREACQTSVDGTSINTIEDVAVQLGLEAEQIMIPADHLLLPEAQALPAMVVVTLPTGLTHFLVIWGRVGRFLQVMDPSTGRRWVAWDRFLNELYIHSFPVPAAAWREWAGSAGMILPLRRRMGDLGLLEADIDRLIQLALQDPGWLAIAVLDAAVRMTAALVRSGGLIPGSEAAGILESFFMQNLAAGPAGEVGDIVRIPSAYWSVQPLSPSSAGGGAGDQLLLRGAVLIRVLGRRRSVESSSADEAMNAPESGLPPELVAALQEPAYQPFREVWKMVRQDGWLTLSILVTAVFVASLTVMIEALMLQGIIQISQNLLLVSQRLAAVTILVGFVLAALLLEFPISSTVLRLGRRLETRLRIAFLEKIPRLGDRYFYSRLTSDMTQRAYDLRSLRIMPNLAVNLLRTGFQLILTTLGVIWLDPLSAPFAILATIFFVGISFLSRPLLNERDLRLRTQVGGLSRFYLDSLLGLTPARTHSAEHAMRRQHESQLVDWIASNREYHRIFALVQGAGGLLYALLAIGLVYNYIARDGEPNEILLLFYWTLNLPALGQTLAELAQQFPLQRNRILRLLEPLSAPDDINEISVATNAPSGVGELSNLKAHGKASGGIGIQFDDVSVIAGGQVILRDIQLCIEPGEHLAIIGPSGAGKSSLVGLLLGWHRPAQGQVMIDNIPLSSENLANLRRQIAWVDPAVQIWNRSLYDNLRYGMVGTGSAPIGQVIQQADLYDLLDRLPSGLKTTLGEGGGLVSGGEGQRVRLGRAFLRSGVRLVILDEPFRGLDRRKRGELLLEAQRRWEQVTLITITHDVGETRAFPRVVVIEDGRIIEDGAPEELLHRTYSRYRELYEVEQGVRRGIWRSGTWRRLWLQDGQIRPSPDE
jgi:ATP-binding cassette subfamily B protein